MITVQTTLSERYRLTALLGRGGMADVYRADDLSLERPVAVKLLRTAAPDDARRFTAEARVLSRLNHEHIVRLFDAGVHEDVPYFVMQLVEGRSLRELLAEGPLGAEDVRRMGVGLADALAHAHAFGVVHRDVKPGNVLVDTDGNVRLADFGIARLADATRLTATGSVLGTAAYAAPEQLRGDRLGPATDVYSMGLVLLEALAGRRHSAATAVETALARLTRDPDIPDDVPPEWTSLLRALTARAPADRPDAEVAARRLRTLGPSSGPSSRVAPPDEEPTSPRRVVTPPVGIRARRRGRWLLAALGAVLVLAVIVVGGWAVLGERPPGDRPPDARPSPAATEGVPARLDRALDRLERAVRP